MPVTLPLSFGAKGAASRLPCCFLGPLGLVHPEVSAHVKAVPPSPHDPCPLEREELLLCHLSGIFFTITVSVSPRNMPQARPSLWASECWLMATPPSPGSLQLWPVVWFPSVSLILRAEGKASLLSLQTAFFSDSACGVPSLATASEQAS